MSKKLIMAAAAAAAADDNIGDAILVPLRNWMYTEAKKAMFTDPRDEFGPNSSMMCSKESIIRKTTIAYGILELLMLRFSNNEKEGTTPVEEDIIRIVEVAWLTAILVRTLNSTMFTLYLECDTDSDGRQLYAEIMRQKSSLSQSVSSLTMKRSLLDIIVLK